MAVGVSVGCGTRVDVGVLVNVGATVSVAATAPVTVAGTATVDVGRTPGVFVVTVPVAVADGETPVGVEVPTLGVTDASGGVGVDMDTTVGVEVSLRGNVIILVIAIGGNLVGIALSAPVGKTRDRKTTRNKAIKAIKEVLHPFMIYLRCV